MDEYPNLWIPGGTESKEIRQARKAIEAYDERLTLARHELTGDWVIFTKLDNGKLYPVIGLGKDLPSPENIRRRVTSADLRHQGEELLHKINSHNERVRREGRRASSEAAGVLAEGLEWGYRKMDKHPVPRIFVPRGL